MKKILLLSLFFSCIAANAQPGKHRPIPLLGFNQNFFSTVYSVPKSDSLINLYFLYKIPFENLIFTKNGDHYSAAIQVSVEVSDSNSTFVERQFRDHAISFDDFSSTLNSKSYFEGFISFLVENKNLTITSRVEDVASNKEVFSNEQFFQKIKKDEIEYLAPIISEMKSVTCGSSESMILSNFGNFIPYDGNSYNIQIPITGPDLEKIFVKLINIKDTIFTGELERSELREINFVHCKGRVALAPDSTPGTLSFFYLPDLTYKLKEGQLEILVSNSEDFQKKKSFKAIVKWIDKPKSLRDSESALKLLRFMITEDSIKSLMRNSDDYDSLLNKFWKNIDPSPSSQFNELMAQYYERIDYSMNTFSTITGMDGMESDRARIYIRLGKPSSIERGSNDDGKVFEIWSYSKMNHKFIFVDEKGTGEFIIKNSL